MKKKITKKKVASKKKPAKKAVKKVAAAKLPKPLGHVTHFFGNIKVAIVKCKVPFARGARLHFRGATTDFTDTAASIQYNHVSIARTKKGQEVGVKVKRKVRQGDGVFAAKK